MGDTIRQYTHELAPIADNITQIKHGEATQILQVANAAALVPLALTLICVIAVFLGVCTTRSVHGSGGCAGFCLKCLGPVFFAPTILIVAFCSASEFGLSIATSSFCVDPDANVLNIVDHIVENTSANPIVYNVTKFYITGQGSNPILEEAANISKQIELINDQVVALGPHIPEVCPDWHGYAKMQSDLQKTEEDVTKGKELLEPKNIYPYYDQAIHKTLCGDVVIGLGWLEFTQVAVALLLLPFLIFVSDRFLTIWHRFQRDVEFRAPLQTEMVV